MSQRQRWGEKWRASLTARSRFALGWAYLAIGLFFLGEDVFGHKSQVLPLGVLWLMLSAVSFAWGVVLRHRKRSRRSNPAVPPDRR